MLIIHASEQRKEAKPTVVPPSRIRCSFFLWRDWTTARQSRKRHALSRVFPGIQRRKKKIISLSPCFTQKHLSYAYNSFTELCIRESGNPQVFCHLDSEGRVTVDGWSAGRWFYSKWRVLMFVYSRRANAPRAETQTYSALNAHKNHTTTHTKRIHTSVLHMLSMDKNSYLLIRGEWVGLLAVAGCGYVSQAERALLVNTMLSTP